MAVSQELSKEFAPRAIERHGLMLLRSADAAQYVERCAEHGVAVLGIDSFLVTNDGVQPLMEHSVDFTHSPRPTEAGSAVRQAAVDFLKARELLDLWFEVVVGI